MQGIQFCEKGLPSQNVTWPAGSFTSQSLQKVHLWVRKCRWPGKSLVLMHASDERSLKLCTKTILGIARTLRTFFKSTIHINTNSYRMCYLLVKLKFWCHFMFSYQVYPNLGYDWDFVSVSEFGRATVRVGESYHDSLRWLRWEFGSISACNSESRGKLPC